jgi:nucleotide-binding universal stress UspA family protein
MLTDVFVPLLTYPERNDGGQLPALSDLLAQFADTITWCGIEVDVPDLADRWGAALIALPQMAAEVEGRSRQTAAELLREASLLTPGPTVSCTTLKTRFTSPGTTVSRAARNHDLAALFTRSGVESSNELAEELLFGSGRPLLLLPADTGFSTKVNRVAVAWDGSAAASRAVFDAMPLIARAKETVLMIVPEDGKAADPAFVQGYLDRHGAKTSVRTVNPDGGSIGARLQSAALEDGADMLVMGGYGHSRLREFVLGGVTADVLHRPTLAVFMSR